MAGVGVIQSAAGNETRLLVSGGWSAEATEQIAACEFDRLEFHSGEYGDFGFLEPYADKIVSLSILGGTWSGAEGLQHLTSLRSLNLSSPIKGIDFSLLNRLETLGLGAWVPRYSKTLFDCSSLRWLHIEGLGESTCENVGRLTRLEGLSLARGTLSSLDGLARCTQLHALQLTHLRKLADVSQIADMACIREIELVESLPLVRDARAIQGRVQLRRLDLRGVDGPLNDLSWLKGMSRLNVLGLRNVGPHDWDAVFASSELKKIALTFAKAPGITIEEVRAIAIDHGLLPTSVKPMGVPTKPLGFVIEFRPEGSTQNLWFWKDERS